MATAKENAAAETKNKKQFVSNLQEKTTYLFRLDTINFVTSNVKKTPGINLSVIVEAGGKAEGETLYDTIWLTTAGEWKINDFLGACKVAKLGERDDVSLFRKFNGKIFQGKVRLEEGGINESTGVKYPSRWKLASIHNPNGKITEEDVKEADASSEVPF